MVRDFSPILVEVKFKLIDEKKKKKEEGRLESNQRAAQARCLNLEKNAWLYKPVTSPPVYPKKSIPKSINKHNEITIHKSECTKKFELKKKEKKEEC